MNKVVARFADGRMVKGTTSDFTPAKDSFQVSTSSGGATGTVQVAKRDLKAVFFVRDFAGNPQHVERIAFDPSRPVLGRKLEVEFSDGEVLVGTTQAYQPNRPGFFMVPADADSNIERCYVVVAATRQVTFV